MSKVSITSHGMSDYVLELTEEELAALRATVEDGDGRKSEVKVAKRVLGVS